MNIIINKDTTFLNQLHKALDNHELTNWELFQLHYQMERKLLNNSFEQLLVPQYLPHITFLDHQLKAATAVLNQMNGRAILADEVGLGKTIEAGLILKEYMLRRQVKNVLLLVPASLVNQWIQELNEKFHIPAVAYRKGYSWKDYSIFISSIDLAKRPQHQEEILSIDYDMVIVDEAHKLKNHRTKNHEFIKAIKKKYCLLLTATPVQNNILEIFNLITILKPGYLGTYEDFKAKYNEEMSIDNDRYLQQLIKQVMIRNVRKDTILNDVKRHVETVWLSFSKEEQSVYDDLVNTLEHEHSFSRITYLKELCSSREACYLSLQESERSGADEIMEQIAQLPHHIKAQKLVELIKSFGDEKVIVFTEYRATQYYLEWYLNQHDISSVSFRGGLKSGRKAWLTELFRTNKQVFIATEAGGEGINLQFCNHVINYDLPWNPMRLEQRIGRVHRYGQHKDMYIYNFAIHHTIEEHIMKLLYKKIDLFENVIGKFDHILAKMQINMEKGIEG